MKFVFKMMNSAALLEGDGSGNTIRLGEVNHFYHGNSMNNDGYFMKFKESLMIQADLFHLK